MFRRTLFTALAMLAMATSPAFAAGDAPPAPLSDDDRALVDKAAAYLDGLGQVKGRFVQTDPRGTSSSGVLYLNRPGKARFEYEGPAQRLVVSDGHKVVVYDGRLKTFNRYPLGSTPLALFLQRHVRLDQKVVVDRVDRLPGGFQIVAHDGRHESQGHITLAFSELTDLSSPTAPQVVNSTGATGGAGAAPLSAGVAMVMKYHITRRYRGGKPRAYLPGMSSAYLTTPTEWNPASLANVTAGWITHLTAIAAATPVAAGTGTHVNISYYQGFTNHTYPSGRVKPIPTPRVTPLVDTINNVSGNPTPGSQRRRNEQP